MKHCEKGALSEHMFYSIDTRKVFIAFFIFPLILNFSRLYPKGQYGLDIIISYYYTYHVHLFSSTCIITQEGTMSTRYFIYG